MKIKILIPVYNDFQSLSKLIVDINSAISNLNEEFSIIIINDASTEKAEINVSNIDKIKSVKIIDMKENQGHARCIASGMKYIFDNDEFDYNMNNPLGKMALNPDVNVRSRGVMEKCSLCIQMTQKVILDAKRDGRKVKDGEFQTACSQACADGAMVFGDVNDEKSVIKKVEEGDRTYRVLESIGTKPNVIYQTKIRNNIKV